MSEARQVPLQRQPRVFGRGFQRFAHALKPRKVSCVTLYAMHLASGVPVDREPGICPVCGSGRCKLARALAQRG